MPPLHFQEVLKMIVNPNSDIILYSGMPLDDTYTDTLYFSTLASQTAFFTDNTYVKRRFTVNTYQRVNEGVFDAQCLADDIYDCNYMAFRNTNFGSKWFYAFVNRVEYVNNGMARVYFTIDPLQTYLFDCTLEACMVEREHSTTDNIGENLEPEPITVNEYEYDYYDVLDFSSGSLYLCDICVMVVDVEATATTQVAGSLYGNIYSGANIKAFGPVQGDGGVVTPQAVVSAINDYLEEYIQKPDSIVNMYISPHFITEGTRAGRDITGYWSGGYHQRSITWYKPANFESFQEYTGTIPYTPANKKIFTYPFSYLHVDNSNGGSLALRFELFDGDPSFRVWGSPLSPVQLSLTPLYYKNNQTGQPLFTEKLVLDEYPLCSWNYDTYKAWVAQNSIPMLIGMGSGTAQGAMAGGGLGFAMGAVSGAIDVASNYYSASIKADTMRGNGMSGNANFANEFAKFRVGRARPTIQQTRVIDNFFSMYGYAKNRVKVPERNARPHFTYVKTRGAKVIGKCPTEDLKKICSIYDNGITWWVKGSEESYYSLDNRPV